MKIRETRIELPELKPRFLSEKDFHYQIGICKGRRTMHQETLNKEIDINEIACIDTEKLGDMILEFHNETGETKGIEEYISKINELANKLNEAGLLRFKPKEK